MEHSGGPHGHENNPVGLILYIPHHLASKRLFTRLLKCGLQRLENLKLNLSLSNVLLAAAAAGNLLGLGDLVPDGLHSVSLCIPTVFSGYAYIGAEVLNRVSLDGVDAELGVRLNNGESTREEELLVAAGLLDDLDQTGLQLLNGSNVVGENTHVTGLGGKVDLDAAQSVMSVIARSQRGFGRASGGHTHLETCRWSVRQFVSNDSGAKERSSGILEMRQARAMRTW